MRYAPYAARAVKTAYRGYKAYNSYTNTKKKQTSSPGVTTQYDRRTIYRKKYMPRGKKRAWKKFTRKVDAVAKSGLGTKTVVINRQITTSVTSDQTLAYCHLYPYNGSAAPANNEVPCNDLQGIMNRDDIGSDGRVYFKSAVMDITFNGYPPDTAGDSPMEVDVYHLVYSRKNYPGSFNSLLTNCENTTQIMTGYTDGLTMGDRGVTPFDLPQLARSGVKILKKTKFFLSRGSATFTYQIRDPKNRYLSGIGFTLESANSEFAKGGWTQTLMFVIKAIPGYTPIAGDGIQIGVTKKYSYVANSSNAMEDGYL